MKAAAGHVGGSTVFPPEYVVTGSDVDTKEDQHLVAAELVTGPMPEGFYLLIWYSELMVEEEGDGSYAHGDLVFGRNKETPITVREHSCDKSTPSNMGGMSVIHLKHGETATFALRLSRKPKQNLVSKAGNRATMRRPQIFLRPS